MSYSNQGSKGKRSKSGSTHVTEGGMQYHAWVNITPLLTDRINAMLSGVTNSGKTTLLMNFVAFYVTETNETVIYRDDTKMEIFYLWYNAEIRKKMIVWHPEGTHFHQDHIKSRTFRTPFDLIEMIHLPEMMGKFHILVVDYYFDDSVSMFAWWRDYYKELLQFRKRKGLVWCYNHPITQFHDEVNDLFASQLYQEQGQREVSTRGTWFIRKCRGFYIRFIGSTHRIKNLNRGVWTQMGFFMFKRSHAADALQLVGEMIPHLSSDRRKKLSEKVGYLKQHEIFIVDNQGHYGIIPNDDVKRVYPKGLDLAGSYDYIAVLKEGSFDKDTPYLTRRAKEDLGKEIVRDDDFSFMRDIRLLKLVPKTNVDIEAELLSGPKSDYEEYQKSGKVPDWLERLKGNPKFDETIYRQVKKRIFQELKNDLRRLKSKDFFEALGSTFDFKVKNYNRPNKPLEYRFIEYDARKILTKASARKINLFSFAESFFFITELLRQLGVGRHIIDEILWRDWRGYEKLNPYGTTKIKNAVEDLLHYVASVNPKTLLWHGRKYHLVFKDPIVREQMGEISKETVIDNYKEHLSNQKAHMNKRKKEIEFKKWLHQPWMIGNAG